MNEPGTSGYIFWLNRDNSEKLGVLQPLWREAEAFPYECSHFGLKGRFCQPRPQAWEPWRATKLGPVRAVHQPTITVGVP
jgi:hypothetical protein